MRVFVGPVCAQTCVPGFITLNLICPRLQFTAALKFSNSEQVCGVFLHFSSIFLPVVDVDVTIGLQSLLN